MRRVVLTLLAAACIAVPIMWVLVLWRWVADASCRANAVCNAFELGSPTSSALSGVCYFLLVVGLPIMVMMWQYVRFVRTTAQRNKD